MLYFIKMKLYFPKPNKNWHCFLFLQISTTSALKGGVCIPAVAISHTKLWKTP